MKISASILLALRFLGFGSSKTVSNARKSLYGAIAGIGISLVPLVIVLVVADGMIEGISSRIIELSTAHFRVADYSGFSENSEDPLFLQTYERSIIENDPTGKVVQTASEIQGLGIAIGKNGRSGATIRCVSSSFFDRTMRESALLHSVEGDLDSLKGNEAFIGKKLASEIGVREGDIFRLLTMRKGNSVKGIPKFTNVRVKAIISSGYQELDALWVFLPFEEGKNILSPEFSSSFINVYIDTPFTNLEPIKYGIMRLVPEGFTVYSWKQLNRSQFQSFTTTRTLLLFIMLLILFIASVNVSSALVMLVMERRKEIAILKSTGAGAEGITFAFILAGFFTGLGGLIVGLPAGIFCALHINQIFIYIERMINTIASVSFMFAGGKGTGTVPLPIKLLDPAYYLEVIPVTLNYKELLVIGTGTLLLSVLVSILPAVRAGQERPLDTMRKY